MPDDAEIDRLAIQLYEADAMQIAVYDTVMQSWIRDREAVRQRYRERAREALQTNRSG